MMRATSIAGLLKRLRDEDDGQDLVEYALLAAFVGLAGLAAINTLEFTLRESYLRWDSETQDLWVMPAPGAGP